MPLFSVIAAMLLALASSGLAAQDGMPPCRPESGREVVRVVGELKGGERFDSRAGRFVVRLTPDDFGWILSVHEVGGQTDLSRLTPPLQFGRKQHIQGWQFRNAENTGPNDGTVNAGQERREFIFSPEVGRTVGNNSVSLADIERVSRFGRGEFAMVDYELSPLNKSERARFTRMTFAVCLSWPSDR
jgi:hypothetical protein